MEKQLVTVFYSNIEDVDSEGLYLEVGEKFTDERKERISRVKNEAARKSIIATGALLDYVLLKYSVYKDMIVSDSCGKPYVKGRDDFYFNISNSGKYVLVAVSNKNIGVDIQKPVDYNEALVQRIVSEADRERLESDIVRRFNLLWAVKEAYVKLTGEGISRDLGEISYEYEDVLSLIIKDKEKRAHGIYKIFDDCYAMAVSAYEEIDVSYVEVKLNER